MVLAQALWLLLASPWLIGPWGDGLADDEVAMLREVQRGSTLQDLDIAIAGRRNAFHEGEEIKFEICSPRDLYVTLLDFRTSGGVVVILPNRYSAGPLLVRAGQRRRVPNEADCFRFRVSGPAGTEHVVAIGTPQPIEALGQVLSRSITADAVLGSIPRAEQRGFVLTMRDILVTPAAQPSRVPYAFAKCSFAVLAAGGTDVPAQPQQVPQSAQPPGDQPSPEVIPQQPEAPSSPQSGPEAMPEAESASPAQSPPLLAQTPQGGAPSRWAVAIGVSRYKDRRLLFASADAKLFADQSADMLGVPKDHRKLLTDAEATCQAVRAAFASIASRADRRDRLYVFFSGHGVRLPDDDGDEADGFDEALLLPDGALRDDEFYRLCNQTWCSEKVLFLDCCYAGGAPRGIKGVGEAPPAAVLPLLDHFDFGEKLPLGARDLEDLAAAPGHLVFAASKPDQVSWEDRRLRQGVFTYYVHQGLAGAADGDRNEVILVEELYGFLRRTVPEHVAQMPGVQENWVQEPVLIGRALPGMCLRP